MNATQLIDKPTRVTKSTCSLLDVLIVSNPNQVKTKGVLELTISDHYLVHATLDLKVPTPAPRFISTRSFKRYKADQFSSDMEHIPWDIINLMESVDEKLDAFNDLFLAGLDSHAPIKTVKLRRKPNPAITPEIKELITKRNQLHTKARKTGSGMDWDAFVRLRREIKRSIRQAERDYFNEQVTINKGSSGCIWKIIRRALPNTSTQCHQYTKDTSTLANEFNRFFVSVGENAANKSEQLAKSYGLDTRSSLISTNVTYAETEQFDFQPVSCADVRKVIMAMPSNKAPGFDKVPLFVVKDCLAHILPAITNIINSSFANSLFPRAWKRGEVVPHLKDGDHEVPNNNRPISLLPVLSKVVERIALCQFSNYLIKNNRLTSHQSGNRKFHSTETLSLLVSDHICKAMDKKQITAMVLIDLSKAFDSLCHLNLLNKLTKLGTSNKARMWFQSYLTNRKQCTRIATSLSEPLTVTHGVPQGSILGPMLFGLYMNDLPGVIKSSNIESYVDDTKIYLSFSTNDVDSCLRLVAEDLRRLAEWCCANHLLVNPDKTKLLLFGTRQLLSQLRDVTVPFLGQELKPVASAKDLGIILDSNLNFNDHVTSLSSSLLSTLCQVNRVRHLFSREILNTILNSLVFSKLFYCSTVWSGTSKDNVHKLQLLQNFAARILTNTKKFDHISPILNELGWLTIEELLNLRDVIMIYKCINGLAPNYLSSKLYKRSDTHAYNTRLKEHFSLPLCRTSIAQRNFYYRALKSWNKLSVATRNSSSLAQFKRSARGEMRSAGK